MTDPQQLRNTQIAFCRDQLLRINFDENSKGDSDVRILDKRLVKASKRHVGACFPCLGDIEKGDLHRVERGLMDGQVGNCRTCTTCLLAAIRDDLEPRYTLGRQRAEERRKGTI